MEGMGFETPKGTMSFRKEDHQALQAMYQFRIKKDQKNEWDLLELVREIPAAEMPLPVTEQALTWHARDRPAQPGRARHPRPEHPLRRPRRGRTA